MTEVYLVLAFNCNENGMVIRGTKTVFEVFANKKLAKKAVDYLNEEWRKGFSTKNFKKVKWFVIETHIISKEDYSKLGF